jgi:histidyl-tRNA synthetase
MPRSEPIQSVRGVRDILPRDRPVWRLAENAAADVARRFGYEEIVTPIIEQLALLQRAGEETDTIAKELYRIEKRGTQNLALRPEATAGVVRAYFEGGLNQGPQPARLYLIGPMFRHDKPQKGRYRQFTQFNVEVIGGSSPGFDAEVIELAHGWLSAVGLNDLRLELNSIGDAKCRPAYLELLKDYYKPLFPRLGVDSQARLERNPLRLLDSKVPHEQEFKESAPKITDHLCEECAAHWAGVQELLNAGRIMYQHNPYLVRGLDYYTRTVFEFYPRVATGQQDALASGGRYDGLAEAEGWPPTAGVGFAGGVDRVIELMSAGEPAETKRPPADVLVLPDGDLAIEAAEVARICRKVLSTAVDYEPKSYTAKIKAAIKLGVRFVVVLTPTNAQRKFARLRDMTNDEQSEVPWAELPTRLV